MHLPIRTLVATSAVALCTFALFSFRSDLRTRTVSAAASSPAPYALSYTKEGNLVPPVAQYREWVYLTSGMDMSYNANPSPEMHMFDNVFVNPESYRSFLATGTWPDKTVFVLESRGAGSKSSINKAGHFQSGNVTGLEVHVKDEARFPGKWAFFNVESESKATLFPQTATCYSCHAQHAAVDTTFVQFYPTLLPIAEKKGTFSEAYRRETAAEAAK